MIKVAIVEDEVHSRETLKGFLTEFCTDVEIVAAVGTVEDAVTQIPISQPDLVFMDIELQSGTGFQILAALDNLDFDLIFTTAFEQYAIKAIKFSSIDYLLKPIDIDELQAAVEKVRLKRQENRRKEQLELLVQNLKSTTYENRKICLASSDGIDFVNIKKILYCEAQGAYTQFVLEGDKKVLVSKNLKEYENLLTEYGFMRSHNSFLINLRQVKKLVKSEGGYILMSNGDQVNISHSKKDEFLIRMTSIY